MGLVKMGNVIILGSQWGDEGKGKIVDLFSARLSAPRSHSAPSCCSSFLVRWLSVSLS